MYEYHIRIPVELIGTRGARKLQNIADNHGSQAVRYAAKPKHAAFRQSRVEELAACLALTLNECAVVVKAFVGTETRELGFMYRDLGVDAPSSFETIVAWPAEREHVSFPLQMILLDVSRDMISRGYLTRGGLLRASVLVVHKDGWSSSFCLDGSTERTKMTEISTLRSE